MMIKSFNKSDFSESPKHSHRHQLASTSHSRRPGVITSKSLQMSLTSRPKTTYESRYSKTFKKQTFMLRQRANTARLDTKTLNNMKLRSLVEKNSLKSFKNKNLFDSLEQVKLQKVLAKMGKKEKTMSVQHGPEVRRGRIVKYSLLGKQKNFEEQHIREQEREIIDQGTRVKYGLIKSYKKMKKKLTPFSKRYRAKPRVNMIDLKKLLSTVEVRINPPKKGQPKEEPIYQKKDFWNYNFFDITQKSIYQMLSIPEKTERVESKRNRSRSSSHKSSSYESSDDSKKQKIKSYLQLFKEQDKKDLKKKKQIKKIEKGFQLMAKQNHMLQKALKKGDKNTAKMMKFKMDNLKLKESKKSESRKKRNQIKTVLPQKSKISGALQKLREKTKTLFRNKKNKRRYTLGEVLMYYNKVEDYIMKASNRRKETIQNLELRNRIDFDKQERILKLSNFLRTYRHNIVNENGRKIKRDPKNSILNRDYAKKTDILNLLQLIKHATEKDGPSYWMNNLRKTEGTKDQNKFLQGIIDLMDTWPSYMYEIIRQSIDKKSETNYETNGFETVSSPQYLEEKIDYPLNKGKIRLFTHRKIDEIKNLTVTGQSKFKLEKKDIIENYQSRKHKFFKPKTRIGHRIHVKKPRKLDNDPFEENYDRFTLSRNGMLSRTSNRSDLNQLY